MTTGIIMVFAAPGRRLLLYLLLLPLFLAGGASLAATAAPAATGRVKVSVLNVRQRPDKRSRKLFALRRGQQVTVLEERGKWLQIKSGRRRGWVYAPLVQVRRPRKRLPAVTLRFDDVPPAMKELFAGPVAEMRRALAAYDPLPLTVVVSRQAAVAERGGEHWLLLVEIPFSRVEYRRRKGRDVGDGTIDLLPYLEHLQAVLLYRRAAAAALIDYRGRQAAGEKRDVIAAYLGLRAANGDLLLLTGKLGSPYAVFAAHLFLRPHAYETLRVDAMLPDCVRDFNKFVLPEPLALDERRTRAAAVYDFFGFKY
ncbi:MAG: SH3 domain-containing protein [Deltaproteobacteria bacterium]|nr:SH3 domain-containing protein [Deltaproteobacteria bacterium]